MTLGDRIVIMSNGRVQQVAPPLEMYQRPANRYVAGFIGTPPTKFFHGRVVEEDGQLLFEEGKLENIHTTGDDEDPAAVVLTDGDLVVPGDGFRLRLPDRIARAAEGRIGDHLVLGLRPEHFDLHEHDEGKILDVTLGVVEPLGSDMDLYFGTKYHQHLVARVPAETGYEDGQQVRLGVQTNLAHLFEPGEFGRNLSLDPIPTAETVSPDVQVIAA